jgi:hypothetical protein
MSVEAAASGVYAARRRVQQRARADGGKSAARAACTTNSNTTQHKTRDQTAVPSSSIRAVSARAILVIAVSPCWSVGRFRAEARAARGPMVATLRSNLTNYGNVFGGGLLSSRCGRL